MEIFLAPEPKPAASRRVTHASGSAGLLYGQPAWSLRNNNSNQNDGQQQDPQDPRFALTRLDTANYWQMDLCLPLEQAFNLIQAVGQYAGSYREASSVRRNAAGWYGSKTGNALLEQWSAQLDGACHWQEEALIEALRSNFPAGWRVTLIGNGSQLPQANGCERPDANLDQLWQCAYALQIAYTNSNKTAHLYKPLLEDLLRPFADPQFRSESIFGDSQWSLNLTDAEIVLAAMTEAAHRDYVNNAIHETADFAELEIHRQLGSTYHCLRGWLQCRLTAIGGLVRFKRSDQRTMILRNYCVPGHLHGVRAEDVESFRARVGLN